MLKTCPVSWISTQVLIKRLTKKCISFAPDPAFRLAFTDLNVCCIWLIRIRHRVQSCPASYILPACRHLQIAPEARLEMRAHGQDASAWALPHCARDSIATGVHAVIWWSGVDDDESTKFKVQTIKMGAKGVMMMIRVTTPPQTGKRGIQNRIKVLVDVDIITRLVSLCVFQALSAISMPIIFDARR